MLVTNTQEFTVPYTVNIPANPAFNSINWQIEMPAIPETKLRTNWKAIKHCKKRSKRLTKPKRLPSANKKADNNYMLHGMILRVIYETVKYIRDNGYPVIIKKEYKQAINGLLKNTIAFI